MPPFRDLSGETFGRLKVLRRAEDLVLPSGQHKVRYECECSCPAHTHITVSASHLKDGHVQSCGCLNRELSSKRLLERDEGIGVKHGKHDTSIYVSYTAMIDRCLGKYDHQAYKENNISICEEWYDFSTEQTVEIDKFREFYNWSMINGWEPGKTLDRIDGTGNYCPENCRWANNYEQSNNLKTNHHIEYNGTRFTIGQFAHVFGFPYDWLYDRLCRCDFIPEKMFHTYNSPYGPYNIIYGQNGPVSMNAIYFYRSI